MAAVLLDKSPAMLHREILPSATQIPDVIEFVRSPKFLGRALYPRQATLLKLIFLQTHLLTAYDYHVIKEWTQGFALPEAPDPEKPLLYLGMHGIQPDIFERVDMCRDDGRRWFREVLAVIGRRGGKGYIGALAGAYILWHFIELKDPQGHYGVDRDKRLATMVFAGKKLQARDNQWRDLVNVLLGAPCFAPYIARPQNESLTMYAPHDFQKIEGMKGRGINTTMDQATFLIEPKEATSMGGRGPAAMLLYFDEMAHVVGAGAASSADQLYDSASPALDQFGKDGFIYAGSSPWQMLGKFFELCQQALEVDHDTHDPVHFDKLMVQLTSWDPYIDWERAHEIPLVPASKRCAKVHFERVNEGAWRPRTFGAIKLPVQTYDARMQRLERANPETFAVERRSHWQAALDVYLNPDLVDAMFGPWDGRTLTMQTQGVLSRTYAAHGDPSSSGANFGWSIAHLEGPDADGLMHVVFDKVHFWAPHSFEDGRVDYITIGKEIADDLKAFLPEEVTFDQFSSIEMMQRLRRKVKGLPKRIEIHERTATAPINWKMAETFKTALGMGLIHSPFHEQLSLEAKFLQRKANRVDHPTTGPIQTKDVWDSVANVVYGLIGDQMSAFLREELSGMVMQANVEGSMMDRAMEAQVHEQLGSLGGNASRFGATTVASRTGWRR